MVRNELLSVIVNSCANTFLSYHLLPLKLSRTAYPPGPLILHSRNLCAPKRPKNQRGIQKTQKQLLVKTLLQHPQLYRKVHFPHLRDCPPRPKHPKTPHRMCVDPNVNKKGCHPCQLTFHEASLPSNTEDKPRLTPSPATPLVEPALRRSTRVIRPPTWQADYDMI